MALGLPEMIVLSAVRISGRELPPTLSKSLARQGVNYEKQFARALIAASPLGAKINCNPWFKYKTVEDNGLLCSPDIISFSTEDEFITVFEVKRTWTPEAAIKLRELYCPVVSRALGLPAVGVVVCKNLVPESPRPSTSISLSMLSNPGLYHWIGNAPVRW